MKRLEGKVAVVTGGNSGIGLASAKRLKEEGARVAIAGRSQKTLDEAAKAFGKDVLAIQADVSKLEDIDKIYAAVAKKFGKIDVLFVNAGVAKFSPFSQTTEAIYDENFSTNVKGAYFTIQKAIPHLNDGASIILNTSVAGIKGTEGTSAYSATKAALRSIARTAASELVGRGIRVNAVAPGPIETPIFGRTGLPQEALRPARGSCRRRGVSCFVRFLVHHRRGAARGWRFGTDLSPVHVESRKEGGSGPLFFFWKAISHSTDLAKKRTPRRETRSARRRQEHNNFRQCDNQAGSAP
jgi:NAD(P)-dependent dehydrogenase (short-subunit alcohol dehydrogenase family)